MEHIERLAAHIDVGLELAHSDQIARRRLALLLLDSAVELMMHREASHLLSQEELTRRIVEQHDAAVTKGFKSPLESQQWIEKLRQELTSNKRRREIERFFDAKAAFLGESGLLQPALTRILRKLHKYRNEAYHEDLLRPHTLDSALQVYILVVCNLLRKLPVRMISSSSTSSVPETISKYLGDDTRIDFDIYERLADSFREHEGLKSSLALGKALSEHLVSRLDKLDEDLEFVANWMTDIRAGESWEGDDVLSLVQIEDDQLAAFATLGEARSVATRITRSHLDDWRNAAGQLKLSSNELEAFSMFADLEDKSEPIEHAVNKAALSVDQAIQHEIDKARGK